MAKYDCGSLGSTRVAALKVAAESKQVRYIYATGCGWTIASQEPPFQQSFYQVLPTGDIALHTYDMVTGTWTIQARS